MITCTKQLNICHQLARDQAEKAASHEAQLDIAMPPAAATPPSVEQPSLVVTSAASSMMTDVGSSPVSVTPVATTITSPAVSISGSSAVLTAQASSAVPSVGETVTHAATPGSLGAHIVENNSLHIVESSTAEASAQDIEVWVTFQVLFKNWLSNLYLLLRCEIA